METYKVNAHDELRFTARAALDFSETVVGVGTLRTTGCTAVRVLPSCVVVHGVAGRVRRWIHVVAVVVRRVSSASVDGRGRHWTRGSACVRMPASAQLIPTLVSVLV